MRVTVRFDLSKTPLSENMHTALNWSCAQSQNAQYTGAEQPRGFRAAAQPTAK